MLRKISFYKNIDCISIIFLFLELFMKQKRYFFNDEKMAFEQCAFHHRKKLPFYSHDFISFAEISMKMYYHVVFFIVMPVTSDVMRHVVFISYNFSYYHKLQEM